jgi:hypothetical protein
MEIIRIYIFFNIFFLLIQILQQFIFNYYVNHIRKPIVHIFKVMDINFIK